MIKEIRRITMERPLTGWSWVWRDSVTGERGRARIELDGLTRGDEVTVELTCECGWEATRFLDVPPTCCRSTGSSPAVTTASRPPCPSTRRDRKSTRLNSSH